MQWIREDIEKLFWHQSSVREQTSDESSIWLQPLKSAIFNSHQGIGAMSRSVAINTQWTQQRVANAGYADSDDNRCRLCEQAVGKVEDRHSYIGGCARLQESIATNRSMTGPKPMSRKNRQNNL